MILALALTALAQDGAPVPDTGGGYGDYCPPGIRPVVTIPEEGASDVALDVRPTVAFDSGCGGALRWQLDLLDAGGQTVATAEVDADTLLARIPPVATVAPGADLLPNSDYTLRLTPLDGYSYYEPVDIHFQTGDQLYDGIHGDPVIRMTEATYFESDRIIDVIVDIETGVAPDGLSATYFKGPAGETFLLGTSGVFAHVESVADLAEEPAEACASVLQIDGRGEILSAEDCMAPTLVSRTPNEGPSRGCCASARVDGDTAFEPPREALVLLGGLGVLLRHRRRDRG